MSEEKKEEMVSKSVPKKDLEIGKIFSEAWEIFIKNTNLFILVLVIVLVFNLIPALIAMIGGASLLGWLGMGALTNFRMGAYSGLFVGPAVSAMLVAALLALVAGVWSMGAINFAVYNTISGKKTTAWENFQLALKKFWVFLAIGIVVGIIVGIGMMLLIVPGIIAAILLFYSFYLVPAEGKSVGEALSRSYALAKKSWVMILVVVIIMGIISVVLSFIPVVNWIANYLIIIFSTILMGCIYKQVK